MLLGFNLILPMVVKDEPLRDFCQDFLQQQLSKQNDSLKSVDVAVGNFTLDML